MDVVGRAHDFCFSFAQLARFVRGKLGLFESPSNYFVNTVSSFGVNNTINSQHLCFNMVVFVLYVVAATEKLAHFLQSICRLFL